MQFNNAAHIKSPEQHIDDFNQPLGLMLESQGVLSILQTDKSGLVQAMMIAVRDALESGVLDDNTAKTVLGENRGNVDFSTLAKADDQTRNQMLKDMHISEAAIGFGNIAVRRAEINSTSVNEGHSIAVPPIGFIHMDLHGKDIPNLGDIKQGALTTQRALDASAAIARMENGIFDAGKGAQRGFKLWGDESPALSDIVSLCESLNKLEEAQSASVPADAIARIESAFDNAAATFKNIGYPALAANVTAIKTHLVTSPATKAEPANDGTNNDNDPAP